jgi:hypothetical protein
VPVFVILIHPLVAAAILDTGQSGVLSANHLFQNTDPLSQIALVHRHIKIVRLANSLGNQRFVA